MLSVNIDVRPTIRSYCKLPTNIMATCEEQFNFFQRTMEELIMVTHFPYKYVTRHTDDKPWVTDYFRHLIRQRQRTLMSGDIDESRRLRNLVNRTSPKLRQRFYQSKIAALEETSSNDWWKHMNNLMGAPCSNTNEMQGLANNCTEGDMTQLVNFMNDFFVLEARICLGPTRHTAFSTSRNHCQHNSRLKPPLHKGCYRK